MTVDEEERRFRNDVGKRLHTLRLESNETVEQIANRCDVSVRSWGNYERGDRTISAHFMKKVCAATQTNPAWLIGLVESRVAPTDLKGHLEEIDLEKLSAIIAATDAWLERAIMELPHDKRARLYSLLYSAFSETGAAGVDVKTVATKMTDFIGHAT